MQTDELQDYRSLCAVRTFCMGFWKSAFEVAQDVTSLGGTYRLRENNKRLRQLVQVYSRIREQLSESCGELAATVVRAQAQISRSEKRLGVAGRILNPLQLRGDPARCSLLTFGPSAAVTTLGPLNGPTGMPESMGTMASTASGIGAGAVATATSWGAAHALGHASTGAAMAGLHGAAASSAGWAWFGGGSLAAGGGGMALGHLVLPGIGTAVAIAVSATMSHSEANRVDKSCSDLEEANHKNTSALVVSQASLAKVLDLEGRLIGQDKLLADALNEAKRRLFGLGFLSHLWRLLRYWFRGYYYSTEEFAHVDRLASAVERFVDAFRNG